MSLLKRSAIDGETGEAAQFRAYRAGIIEPGNRALDFFHLCTDQEPVPESLQAVINQPFLAVEETELKDQAIKEIGRCADLIGDAIINLLLQETLDRRCEECAFADSSVSRGKSPRR